MAGMETDELSWVAKGTRTHFLWLLALLAAASIGLLFAAEPAQAKTFTVDTTVDLPDPNLNDDACVVSIFGGCTLRAAIEEANATDGADTINFDISSTDTSCNAAKVCTISPESELPNITERATINGYSQPGSSPNTRTSLAQGTNAILRIELDGSGAGEFSNGLVIGGGSTPVSNVVIKGLVINRFAFNGILFSSVGTGQANKVQGNFIGTSPSGKQDEGNGLRGVRISGGSGGTIGGSAPEARNLISGNDLDGIDDTFASASRVVGNLIGTESDGTIPLGNSANGIKFSTPGNTIGGTTSGTGNAIAFNGQDGVVILDSDSRGNRILRNSIFSNGQLGIDLDNDGQTLNDTKDPDTGPNRLQNFPRLTSAAVSSTGTTVKGTLNSIPDKSFTVQFFSNPFSSGADEGKTFLGEKVVTTNSNGNVTFTFQTSRQVFQGQEITATATRDSTGDTSEFSNSFGI